MKHYQYWIKKTFNINVGRHTEIINVLAGSNESKAHAEKQAQLQASQIEQRIAARESKEEYDVAIKEFVAKKINADNVISVCRYGAKIWNTTQYTILDLDDYPRDFLDFFRGLGRLNKKQRILYKFEQRLKKYPQLGSDFRVYETSKGIRVIGKKYIDPRAVGFLSLMKKFHVDVYYAYMCIKQNCYRARVTPKPYRLRIPTIKIKTPIDCEQQHYKDWQQMYQDKSKNVSVVSLLKILGNDFAFEPMIKRHDELCNTRKADTARLA